LPYILSSCRCLPDSRYAHVFASLFLSLLINIEYTKLWPTKTVAGLVISLNYSPAKLLLT